MTRINYDFHIHSCLSPCGDDGATPASIAGFAKLNGLDAAALCDHNTCANCPAFFQACAEYGVQPLAGMELTTAEDIHLICLFSSLDTALEFSAAVEQKLIKVKNRVEFFGNQIVMSAADEPLSQYEWLLPNATSLSLEQAFELAQSFGAACYPAHVDRENNGIIAILGNMPQKPLFTCAEFNNTKKIPEYLRRYPVLAQKRLMFGSDAHCLENISDSENLLELPDSGGTVSERIISLLRGDTR